MKKLKLSGSARVSLLAGLTLGIVSLLGAGSAMAYTQYSITGVAGITGNVEIGGQAQNGAHYANFDSQPGASQTSFTSGGLSVSFAGNAGTGPGTIDNGTPALPWLSGNNNVNFESPSTIVSGGVADPTTFLRTGDNGSSAGAGMITFSFGSTQNYFGLLWGSMDYGAGVFGTADNLLTFWSGPNGTGSVVATIDGAQVAADDPTILAAGSGNTGLDGTAYVNLDLAGGYQSVVTSSGNFTFEIDNVAWAGGSTRVPDAGSTLSLLGIGFGALAGLRRRLARA